LIEGGTACGLFDRDGQPITVDEFWTLYEAGLDYGEVAFDEVGPGVEVITAWAGHGYPPDGPWQIFDTTVWVDGCEVTCMLPLMKVAHPPMAYRTEAEARDGHTVWLEWARARYVSYDPVISL
jgi:hypothetical protein